MLKSFVFLFFVCPSVTLAYPIVPVFGISVIDKSERPFVLPVNVILGASSGWSTQTILSDFRGANKILRQCGIEVAEVSVYLDTIPEKIDARNRDLEAYVSVLNEASLLGFRDSSVVTVAFIRELRFDGKRIGGQALIGKSLVGTGFDQFIQNVAILPYAFGRGLYEPGHILAHELGHLLLEADHVDVPNLMSGLKPNKALNKSQCQVMRASHFVLPNPGYQERSKRFKEFR